MKLNITIDELKVVSDVQYDSEEQKRHVNDVRTSHLTDDMAAENMRTLEKCKNYYNAFASWRDKRVRAIKYRLGDQWSDTMTDDDGNTVTEEEYIRSKGKPALKQNLISSMIRTILGQYRANKSKVMVVARDKENNKAGIIFTNMLRSIQRINESEELDTVELEEGLISGLFIQKVYYDYHKEYDKMDVKFENVNQNTFFMNPDILDPRIENDLRLIGEIKDVPLNDVLTTFARNEGDVKKIKEWYSYVDMTGLTTYGNGFDSERIQGVNFDIPTENDKVRVIEVWELVSDWRIWVHDTADGSYQIVDVPMDVLLQENERRTAMAKENNLEPKLLDIERKYEQFWTVKFLTPYGQCLFQSETPYKHQSHPYIIAGYPMIDGEIQGLVTDLIDQQRSINRAINLLDFIVGASAKGMLLIPEESIPKGMTVDDFADKWSKFDGVISYKSKGLSQLPQQIASNSVNVGLMELLQVQLKLFQDVGGVSDALQGKTPKSGTASSLYAQQAVNSATNIKDIISRFNSFVQKRNRKALKVAQQFYDDRYITHFGRVNKDEENTIKYNKETMEDMDFDFVITEGADTPVYRNIMEEQLKSLLEMKAISIESYLENSTLPFADKLLEALNKEKEKMQNGQPMTPTEMTPQLQAVMQAANKNAPAQKN